MNNLKALTFDYNGLTNIIETNCNICPTYNPDNQHSTKFRALWDTGAMASVISAKVVNDLQLQPVGRAKVIHANGESLVDTYMIDIQLINNIEFCSLHVTEGLFTDTDVLIGMDIISQGDFAITSHENNTKLSFQVPSTHNIDFVKEIIDKNI
ncbi:MAG: retroviral-like aspartic protease family protein [Prevotellaceae bacterium]|jgi:hypothetical protein|nr:retroviral-like aspartic protease family protein [Prevotellaceae bacterium]